MDYICLTIFGLPEIGLTLDILGAYFLAFSLIHKNDHDIINETTEGEDEARKSLIKQKTEARLGFTLLFLGFVMQGLGRHITISFLSGASLLVVFVGLGILTLLLRKLLTSEKMIKRSLTKTEEVERKDFSY